MRQQVSQCTDALKQARERVKLAEADCAHLETLRQQTSAEKRQLQLQSIAEKLALASEELSQQVVTDTLAQAFQQAELDYQIARGQLDTAASKIRLQALTNTSIAIDGEPVDLKQGEQQSQFISHTLSIEFPDLARITIEPPARSKDIERQFMDAENRLQELQRLCSVETAAQAAAASAQRQNLQNNIAQLKAQEQNLSGHESLTKLSQQIGANQREIDHYSANRQSDSDMPTTLEKAQDEAQTAKRARDECEETLETLNARLAAADQDRQQAQRNHAKTLQQVEVKQALLSSARKALDEQRSGESDAALAGRLKQATTEKQTRQRRVSELEADIDAQSLNTVQSLEKNAKAVLAQTRKQLAQSEQALAVANDRLVTARADGRFETFESAKREAKQQEVEVNALQRRAAAAQLLWETLNQSRNATRQAYIEPLKQAVEQLGRIVFGPGFAVQVDENWQISERALDGKTLPISSLSIGAQEQLSLLGRLAAAQLVSRHEGVPLIIDDALGFSDPQRLKTLGAAIAAAGRKCQIIILTCTPGRFQNVGGAKFVNLP